MQNYCISGSLKLLHTEGNCLPNYNPANNPGANFCPATWS